MHFLETKEAVLIILIVSLSPHVYVVFTKDPLGIARI